MKHIKGDIFESEEDVILHQVNCRGKMNSGVAKQVREKYPWVYGAYKNIYNKRGGEYLFGRILRVFIDERRSVVNIFSQKDYGYDGAQYTDYEALRQCLVTINKECYGRSIAIPYRMGCCRGGGDWAVVSKMIEETLTDCDVTIYECDKG